MSGLSKSSTYELSDGHTSPIIGLGLYQEYNKGDVERAVLAGIRNGYKKIDTSAIYQNEAEIGTALKKSSLCREDVYITTKLANEDQGRESTFKAFHRSLDNLDVEYIDLYIVHTPLGGNVVESWGAMLELQKQGLVRSIGVSNFNIDHLEELNKAYPDNPPAVNQFEMNIYRRHLELLEYCRSKGIAVEVSYPAGKGTRLERHFLTDIALRFVKSQTQIMIRWVLQSGFPCIVKALQEDKVQELGNVFDFSLTEEDMKQLNDVIKRRDNSGRWDPMNLPWEG